MSGLTWSLDHPHVNDTTWTAPGGPKLELVTWTWAVCSCGVRTAVVVDAVGDPICFPCFVARAGLPVPLTDHDLLESEIACAFGEPGVSPGGIGGH